MIFQGIGDQAAEPTSGQINTLTLTVVIKSSAINMTPHTLTPSHTRSLKVCVCVSDSPEGRVQTRIYLLQTQTCPLLAAVTVIYRRPLKHTWEEPEPLMWLRLCKATLVYNACV